MSFGKDLEEFVNAFSAGYNMIGQSQKDKAAMEESKARTGLITEQTKEMPAKSALEAAQANYYMKRGEWYDEGAPHTSIKADPSSTLEGSTANALGGGSGAIPDSSSGPAQQYAPGDASSDQLPVGFDDSSSTEAPAADTSGGDQSNYAPSTGAVPDYRTSAPTAPSNAPASLSQLFPAIDQRYSLPSGYAQTVAAIETGHTYDPSIVNPNSKAAGLFQFMPTTAKAMGVDPLNPASAAHGFGQLTNANQQILTKALGRAPSPAELYLAHQQGPAAAGLMLNHPTMSALDVLTHVYQQAGAKNPQAIAQQALTGNGGNVNMTAGQFASKWLSTYNRENARVTGQGNQTQVASAEPMANPGAAVSDASAPDALSLVSPETPSAPNGAQSAVNAVGDNPAGNPTPLQAGLKAGMIALSDRFAPQGNGAIPDATSAPNVHGYMSGDGAAPPNVVQQLRKIVPGAAKMDDGQFGAAAISFIMKSDKLQPAQRAQAVGDLLQYYRNGFNQYAAIAKAAVQSGNLDDAVKASVRAYMHVPDGQTITALKQDDSGKYLITIKDDKTGDVQSQQLLSPSEMGAQIMKTTPALFDQAVAQMIATPQKPTTITDAGRNAAASLSDENTDAAQAIGQAQTPADVVAIKTAAAMEDKQAADNKSLGDNATQFVAGLGAQFDRPNVIKNLGPNVVNQYKSVLADHQTSLEAAAASALRSKNYTPAELMDAANNILEIKGMDPNSPPSFQASTNGARTKVEWDGGDITIPTKTFKAFLAVRHDLLTQLVEAKKSAVVASAPARRDAMSQPDQGGGVRGAIPAPGNNPWEPSPGNVPAPATPPGPWDAPLGAQSAVDPNDPKRLNLPPAF